MASHATGTYQTDKVESATAVDVGTQTDAVTQHSEIEPEVELILFLPRQILVLQRLDINLRFLVTVIATVSGRVTEHGQSVVCRSHCSCQSVCGTQREGGNHILMFHKLFFQHIPRPRHVPRRQPTGITRTSQAVGTIHTPRQVERVASLIRKASGGKERHKTVIILRQAVVIISPQQQLLYDTVVYERRTATIPLEPVTVVETGLAVG